MTDKEKRFYEGGARPVDARPKKVLNTFFDVKDTSYKRSDESLLNMFQNMFGMDEGEAHLNALEREVAEGKRRQRNMIIAGIVVFCAFFC